MYKKADGEKVDELLIISRDQFKTGDLPLSLA